MFMRMGFWAFFFRPVDNVEICPANNHGARWPNSRTPKKGKESHPVITITPGII